MRCPQCGKEILSGMKFCPGCGVSVTQTEKTSSSSNENLCRVVFERCNSFTVMFNDFVIKVNGKERIRLKNAETKEIRLPKGAYPIEIGVFGCKPLKFDLIVDRDRHIKCSYSPLKGGLLNPWIVTKIVAKDENGVELKKRK